MGGNGDGIAGVGADQHIRDRVGFHADIVDNLREAFYEAVENYIETCASIGKEPQPLRTRKPTDLMKRP